MSERVGTMRLVGDYKIYLQLKYNLKYMRLLNIRNKLNVVLTTNLFLLAVMFAH